jgi:hypothetical protein
MTVSLQSWPRKVPASQSPMLHISPEASILTPTFSSQGDEDAAPNAKAANASEKNSRNKP